MTSKLRAMVPPNRLGHPRMSESLFGGRYTHRRHGRIVALMAKRRGSADIFERFGDALRARREALGLTQEALAEAAAIHRTYLSDVERGTRNVSLLNIERLAAALSIPLPNSSRRWADCADGTSTAHGLTRSRGAMDRPQ